MAEEFGGRRCGGRCVVEGCGRRGVVEGGL